MLQLFPLFALSAGKFRSQFCNVTLRNYSPSLLLYYEVFVFHFERMVLCLCILMFCCDFFIGIQIFLERGRCCINKFLLLKRFF